jgi:uncharacterized protein (TIGR00255 family)
MTAFGRSQTETRDYRVTVEVRALNSRGLDIVLRFPKNTLDLEDMARKSITRQIQRGRIEIFLQLDPAASTKKPGRINLALALAYWEQLLTLQRELPGVDAPTLDHLLRMPDILEGAPEREDPAALQPIVSATLEAALADLDRMRRQEGEALLTDLSARLDAIDRDIHAVLARKEVFLPEYQQRLRDRLEELLGNLPVDENRLSLELAIFAERSDISEEIVRARSHLEQMRSLLRGTRVAEGRTLEFLTQELHREVNTIGAKANDLDITQAVVRMKGEIARIREQVQNIE